MSPRPAPAHAVAGSSCVVLKPDTPRPGFCCAIPSSIVFVNVAALQLNCPTRTVKPPAAPVLVPEDEALVLPPHADSSNVKDRISVVKPPNLERIAISIRFGVMNFQFSREVADPATTQTGEDQAISPSTWMTRT